MRHKSFEEQFNEALAKAKEYNERKTIRSSRIEVNFNPMNTSRMIGPHCEIPAPLQSICSTSGDKPNVSADEIVAAPEKKLEDFSQIPIGTSEYACIIFVGPGGRFGITAKTIHFGENGEYQCFLVDENHFEIDPTYKREVRFHHWLKVYDDKGLVREFNADDIIVYRTRNGERIIQLINHSQAENEQQHRSES